MEETEKPLRDGPLWQFEVPFVIEFPVYILLGKSLYKDFISLCTTERVAPSDPFFRYSFDFDRVSQSVDSVMAFFDVYGSSLCRLLYDKFSSLSYMNSFTRRTFERLIDLGLDVNASIDPRTFSENQQLNPYPNPVPNRSGEVAVRHSIRFRLSTRI